MEVWVFGLLIWWLRLYLRGRVDLTPAFIKARPALLLLLVWLLFLLLQIVGLPAVWVEAVSPGAGELFGLVGLGRFTLSLDPFAASAFLLKSLAYSGVFALSLLLLRRSRRIRLMVMVLVLSGVVQAVYGGLMVLSGLEWGFLFEKEYYRGLATGTFINRNHLAGYLEMSLAAGIGLLVADLGEGGALNWRQRLRNTVQWLLSPKMRLRIYLAVMVIGLVLTHSRMGNTAFFSSLIITGVLWSLLSRKRPKRGVLILLASLLIIDIYIVGAWFGVDKVVERLENTSAASETRDEVVRHGLDYLRDYPMVGSGAGSFYAVFPGYREGDVKGYYNFAHNDYLQFGVETGGFGLGLMGLVLLWSAFSALRAVATRSYPLQRGLGFTAFMGILALMIPSTVDFNLQIPAHAAMFMLILAFAWIGVGYRRPEGLGWPPD